jgi:hypothetical protein
VRKEQRESLRMGIRKVGVIDVAGVDEDVGGEVQGAVKRNEKLN